ncbi:MAG: hypothetical protein QM691_09530 [Opitutaceae bacterium]
MKPNRDSQTTPRRSFRGLPLAVFLSLVPATSPLSAADPAETPKDHALFVGGDLCVNLDGAKREVIGATKEQVILLVDGRRVSLPLDKVANVQVVRSLKLSDLVAQIDGATATPTKLQAKTERAQWLEQRFLLGSIQDQAASDFARAFNAQQNAASRMVAADSSSDASAAYAGSSAKSDYASASAAADKAASAAATAGSVSYRNEAQADALEVVGRFSAPKAVHDAFVLLVTGIRENPKADVQYQIHVEPLGELGPKPRRVNFTQGGLPPGYVLESYALHVFADGRELATNLSEKRVDLTADDALRYLTLCYITKHAKETRAAEPLRIAFPTDFRAQAKPDWLARPLYLTVGADGVVQKAAADQAGAALDPYLGAIVARFRFMPALKEGKAVESVIPFALADFVR